MEEQQQQQQQQVAEAAKAMVSPTTDSTLRRQASQFLEAWTQTSEAWSVYIVWLQSYRQRRQSSHHHEGNYDNSSSSINHTGNDANSHQVALQLLCLTMLQSKIRREVFILATDNNTKQRHHNHHPHVAAIRTELWLYLQQPHLDKSLVGPACICNAALIVRCGEVGNFISHITRSNSNTSDNSSSACIVSSSSSLDDVTSLRLLACVPSEMESCQGLSPSEVTGTLVRYLEPVLDTIRRALTRAGHREHHHNHGHGAVSVMSPEDHHFSVVLPACHALKEWTEIAHVSLTQLNTPTCGGQHALLPILVSILSSQDGGAVVDEMTLQMASKALTNAILVVSDQLTPTREAAAAAIWQAIPQQGFIVNPLHVSTRNEWHDASHALATLLSTFVTEQVEDVVAHPAGVGLQVLLELQRHPHTPVAVIPLECWLTIQDVDIADRHEDWKQPLYRQLLPILVSRVAYPNHFVNWEEELEIDSSEFNEFRRLVSDVLASCYFLLRVEMVQLLTQKIRSASDWTESEASIWCLTQISKDVCARCKSPAPNGTMVGQDKLATCNELLGLLEQLIANLPMTGDNSQRPVLLTAVINFCGTYSPAWNSMNCPPDAILQLLSYLQTAFATFPLDTAKATRAIYISCLAKNILSLDNIDDVANGSEGGQVSSFNPNVLQMVLKSLRLSMDSVLPTTDEEAMVTVAEGATRLITKLREPNVARHALTVDLTQPVISRIHVILQTLPDPSVDANSEIWVQPEVQHAAEALVRCLAVLQVIARFCDAPHIPAIGEWLLEIVGPCLEAVQQRTTGTPTQHLVFPKWLGIHQQILRNTLPLEQTMITIFNNTIPIVVQALEQTRDPTTLRYISTAVENFGGTSSDMDRSFQDILSHVTSVVTQQPNLLELTDLLQAYFDCLQRYTLYCPRALCNNPQFATIMTLSVEATQALQAKESSRASLNFMSQLFGFHSLRLSPHSTQVLKENWNPLLVDCLVCQGPKLVQYCVAGLAGGSQMLWPAFSDCLFAVVQAIVLNQSIDEEGHSTNPALSNAGASALRLNESIIEQWLLTSLSSTFLLSPTGTSPPSSVYNESMVLETCRSITSILLHLARVGPKSKPKAKLLLTDFAKFKRGEISPETLASYALI